MVNQTTGEIATTIPASLAQKLHKVIEAITPVGKGGFNEMQRYAYATEGDVIEATRPAFVTNRVLLLVDTLSEELVPVAPTKSGTQQFMAKILLQYTIVDVDTGSFVQLRQAGHGLDTGDKGIYKAYTGANKYFLMKLCQIATTDDPENEGKDKSRNRPPASNKLRTATSTPQPSPSKGGAQGPAPVGNPVSPAQIDKINKLIVQKSLPDALATELMGWLDSPNKSSGKAGVYIAKLIGLKDKPSAEKPLSEMTADEMA